MMYKVISTFADLLDNNYIYNEGGEYPRNGYSPSSERIEELSTNKNRLHKPLIQLIEDSKPVVEPVVEEPKEVVEVAEKPTRGRRKAKDESNTD